MIKTIESNDYEAILETTSETGDAYFVRFEIYQDCCERETIMTGDIKWDGCMNFTTSSDTYLHICGIDGLERLQKFVVQVYQTACTMMPEHADKSCFFSSPDCDRNFTS